MNSNQTDYFQRKSVLIQGPTLSHFIRLIKGFLLVLMLTLPIFALANGGRTPITTTSGASINPTNTGVVSGNCALCSVLNADHVIDGDGSNFAQINMTAGIVAENAISVQMGSTIPAGTYAGFSLAEDGVLNGLLDQNILQSLVIRTYAGGVIQEEYSGDDPAVGKETIINDPQNFLGFFTSSSFDEIQISLGGNLLSALTTLNVYSVFTGTVPIDAIQMGDFGATLSPTNTFLNSLICLNCSLTDTTNVIDADTTNSANITLQLATLADAAISVSVPTPIPAGTVAGFAVLDVGNILGITGLLNANVLGSITINTYMGGTPVQSIDASNPLLASASVLPGTGINLLSFESTAPFDEIQIAIDALAGVAIDLQVFYAYAIGLCPPEILNNNSNPTNSFTVDENVTGTIIDINSVDDIDTEGNGLTYALSGSDANLFSIDALGNLVFNNPPDFENPADAGGDNIYDVTVTVTDSDGLTDFQALIITVGNLNDNPPTVDPATPSIDENSPNGTTVTTATGNDPDGDPLQDWMIVSGNTDVDGDGNLPFSIDPVTGVITVNDSDDLDFEDTPCFDLGVTVSDGTNTSAPETIQVCLNDLNDNPPTIDPAAPTVDENSPNGTSVVTLTGSDPDGDTLQDWMIIGGNTDVDGDGNLPFSIDPTTGEITVNDSNDLDFETMPCFDLQVTVSDGTNTSTPETIQVCLNDIAENQPPIIIDQSPTIDENSPSGTTVADIDATDPDGDPVGNFMIIGGNTDVDGDGNLPFSIDPNTGLITVNDGEDLDFEAMPCFDLVITASDGMATSAPETITVCLNDINENMPPIIIDQDPFIDENSPNGTTVADIEATDPDGDPVGNFMIIGGNTDVDGDGNLPFSIDPNTGIITVNDEDDLDFETMPCFDLTVTASDGMATSAPETITVCLNNLNDNPPMVIDNDVTIDENSPNGTTVVDVEGTDPDGDPLQDWMIVNGNTDVDGDGNLPFSIDPNTGVITINDEDDIDFEAQPCFDLGVTVSDGVFTSAEETISICLNNLNDNPPFINPAAPFIDENSPNGTSVTTLTGSDPDGDTLQDWMIIGGNADVDGDGNLPFSIDPNTGEIVVEDSGDLDFETLPCFDLVVTVSDGINTSAPETITVCLNNLNDNPPVIDPAAPFVDENSPAGTSVTTLTGSDADGDTLQDWMIIGGNTDVDGDGNVPFTINPTTGEITVNDSDDLDFETMPCFDLVVTVSDGTNTSAPETITVCLNDLLENPNAPDIIDENPFIDENSPNGTPVTDLEAIDPDGDPVMDWMIIGGNTDVDGDGNVPFDIDPNTGILTVNDSGDLDFETMPCFDLIVTVSDGINVSDPETITVCLNNLNDNPPVVIDNDVTIDENSANGTLVVDVEGTDADGDLLQDWMIVNGNMDVDGDGNQPFTIDPNTGVITVNDSGDLDFETIECFDLGVTVSDGVFTSAVETITVCLNDVNEDNLPPIIVNVDPFIPENPPNDTLVVDLEADDPEDDPLDDWMITDGNEDKDGDGEPAFAIDPQTGEVTVNDADDVDFELCPCFDLIVTVSDGTNTSPPETITICLNDENEPPIIVNVDPFIPENPPNDTLVVDLEADDPEDDPLDDWMITDGNEDKDGDGEPAFAIDPQTGEVTVNDADDVDFELCPCFDLIVTVSDGTNTSPPETITICLNDENEPPIIVNVDPFIPENPPNDTLVVDLEADDPEDDPLDDWMITDGNEDKDGDGEPAFAIDPQTGEVTVNDADDVDFELCPCFDLIVTVSDGTNTSPPETITICLNDENEPPIIVNVDPFIPENPPNDTLVVDLEADDPEDDPLDDWMITDGNEDKDGDGEPAFAIDPETGEITVNDADDVDFELCPCFNLVVTVSDGTNTSPPETITVCLEDDMTEDDDDDGVPQSDDPDDNDPCVPNPCDDIVQISAKLFLAGAYLESEDMMQDSLRSKGYLPTTEPYGGLGFNQVGAPTGDADPAVFEVTGNDAIVDWIFLELRSANNPAIVLSTRSAFVQRDGDVVDIDGTSPVSFNINEGEYYLAARHRNHLGVMTAQTINVTVATSTFVDFSNPDTPTWGTNAQAEMEPGVMGLWAGNAKMDDQVIYQGNLNDLSDVFFDVLTATGNPANLITFIHEGYGEQDLNMDGSTIYQGPNNDLEVPFLSVLSHPDNSLIVVTYIILEQLP